MTLVAGPRWAARWALKVPIHIYRMTLKPFVGWQCRHLPTCSEYGLEAIDRNGAWRGGWLTASRLSRCRPGGTDGYDPVPDVSGERHPLAPWRYGRWTRKQVDKDQQAADHDATTGCSAAKSADRATGDDIASRSS